DEGKPRKAHRQKSTHGDWTTRLYSHGIRAFLSRPWARVTNRSPPVARVAFVRPLAQLAQAAQTRPAPSCHPKVLHAMPEDESEGTAFAIPSISLWQTISGREGRIVDPAWVSHVLRISQRRESIRSRQRVTTGPTLRPDRESTARVTNWSWRRTV